MGGIFVLLLFVILFVLLVVFSLAIAVLSALFGGMRNALSILRNGIAAIMGKRNSESRYDTWNKDSSKRAYSAEGNSNTRADNGTSRERNMSDIDESFSHASSDKIFAANEGEYVDFEEIKD